MKIIQADILAEQLTTMLQTKGIVGYKIARNLRMINDELIEYHSIKERLFREYGEQVDDRLIINTHSDNYQEYLKEIDPYLEQEVKFDFKMISEEELQNSDLTAEQMYILYDYMVEVKDERY